MSRIAGYAAQALGAFLLLYGLSVFRNLPSLASLLCHSRQSAEPLEVAINCVWFGVLLVAWGHFHVVHRRKFHEAPNSNAEPAAPRGKNSNNGTVAQGSLRQRLSRSFGDSAGGEGSAVYAVFFIVMVGVALLFFAVRTVACP
jgi:hypothetical protein